MKIACLNFFWNDHNEQSDSLPLEEWLSIISPPKQFAHGKQINQMCQINTIRIKSLQLYLAITLLLVAITVLFLAIGLLLRAFVLLIVLLLIVGNLHAMAKY